MDPSGVAVHNGQFLGLDVPLEKAKMVLLPIPWDVTTSYRPGTVWGPQVIVDASYQLDLFSPYMNEVWKLPLHTLPISDEWTKKSQSLRNETQRYIDFLEEGGDIATEPRMQEILRDANKACRELHEWSEKAAAEQLRQGRRVLTVGGDHSVSLGPIRAAADHFGEISVLHFDAHADLRDAYEGFDDSHASIMFNVMKHPKVRKLVQVGIRDVSPVEIEFIKKSDRVRTFFDWELQGRKAGGESWKKICEEVVSHLGPQVYISFDIDGLDPKLCPNTGTPVPGGLELFEATFLLQTVIQSGRKIVGADLVEVAPGPEGDEWDGNVGARTVFQLAVAMAQSL
jgi:agmatinase